MVENRKDLMVLGGIVVVVVFGIAIYKNFSEVSTVPEQPSVTQKKTAQQVAAMQGEMKFRDGQRSAISKTTAEISAMSTEEKVAGTKSRTAGYFDDWKNLLKGDWLGRKTPGQATNTNTTGQHYLPATQAAQPKAVPAHPEGEANPEAYYQDGTNGVIAPKQP